ncbi:calcineurin-like phosphoesterase family protein [Leptospira broomii serovar Hurstbridge str. 5399]|uniref:Calcineurin-like phosphoesterase family protein n=1 Tax=Leptospira broomii serovar Hurstbridge str. 5399 TaxID=1049789 RepID=T0F8U6_9LEPT|nr:metallophosphoesterase [Leptospira broomii]EQA44336.1 calcineurin-like phosphoesterase family protein [Leptospira broomii serovar Hurstbridge str. 5399]
MEFELQRFYIFLGVFTVILFLAYSYAVNRLSAPFELNSVQQGILWLLVIVFVLLTPTAYLLSLFYRETQWQKLWSYAAFTSLGFFTLLVSFVVFHDLGKLAWKGWVVLSGILQSSSGVSGLTDSDSVLSTAELTRKDFLSRLASFLVIGFTGGLTVFGFYQAHKSPALKKVSIKVPGLPEGLEGFKIAQLSDIHIGPTIKKGFLEGVVRRTNELDADLVAITGDLVDGTVSLLREHTTPLRDLSSKYGTFFVTGNHEYYSGAIAWIHELKEMGVNVLLNQNKLIAHKGATIAVAGVTDYKAHSVIPNHRTDPERAAIGIEGADFKLLLAHQPNSIFEAAKAGFDLQLSGHTHGGQYFPGNLLIHIFQKFVAGLSKWEGTQLYVSRGTGYWGPPLRIGAPSEITLLILERA